MNLFSANLEKCFPQNATLGLVANKQDKREKRKIHMEQEENSVKERGK